MHRTWVLVQTGSTIRKGLFALTFHGRLTVTFLYSFGVGLFAYQSLDAIDGKQARRTGASGPLGELFDHGKPRDIA